MVVKQIHMLVDIFFATIIAIISISNVTISLFIIIIIVTINLELKHVARVR